MAGRRRGGYVLVDPPRRGRRSDGGAADADDADGPALDLILIATGSELHLATGAAERLAADGIRARVVSLPCWELFQAQDAAYRESVLPRAVRRRLSIEAGASLGWERWVGDEGAIIAIDRFGASAPAGTIFQELGFTVDHVTDVAHQVARGEIAGIVPPTASEGGHPGASMTDRSSAAGTDPGHS